MRENNRPELDESINRKHRLPRCPIIDFSYSNVVSGPWNRPPQFHQLTSLIFNKAIWTNRERIILCCAPSYQDHHQERELIIQWGPQLLTFTPGPILCLVATRWLTWFTKSCLIKALQLKWAIAENNENFGRFVMENIFRLALQRGSSNSCSFRFLINFFKFKGFKMTRRGPFYI